MKKILYTGQYNGIVGGIERYMQQSALCLRRNGYEVNCLYTRQGGKDPSSFAAAFDHIEPFSPRSVLLQSADLIVIHTILPEELLQILPRHKCFFFAHDHNIYCRRHHYYTPVGRTNCHRKYAALRCFVCSLGRNEAPPLALYRSFPALVLSEFMADNLKKNGFRKIVKLPVFTESVPRTSPFMPDGRLRILFLGQLIRGKGADLMLKTLSDLNIPFDCTIAGDGNDRPMLEKMAAEFRLTEKVHFSGFVSEPEKLWEKCDVFFFPVRWQEPFGLVGVEAMAHGVPAVAFDTGGVREWLAEGETGFALPEKDTAGAAGALTALAAAPELLDKMGRNALALVKEKFSEKCFIDKFSSLFEVIK